MKCYELMKKSVFCVHENDSAAEAARIMADEGIGFLPVYDDSEHLTGVITDRDLVTRVMAGGKNPNEATVGTFASSDLVTCSPSDDLEHAEQLMSSRQKSRLAVVDDDGKCVGVISLSDIAQLERAEQAGAILKDVTTREAPASAPA